MENITFKKSGNEIKQAITLMQQQLRERLEIRNRVLEQFLEDKGKVRSYLIRSSINVYSVHGSQQQTLFSKNDISSEEKESIEQLCKRIYEIEQEINQLSVVAQNIDDFQEVNLSFKELLRFGFGTENSLQVE